MIDLDEYEYEPIDEAWFNVLYKTHPKLDIEDIELDFTHKKLDLVVCYN